MKTLTFFISNVLILLLPVVAKCQQGPDIEVLKSGTSDPFTSAQVCSGNSSDNPKIKLIISNFNIPTNSALEVEIARLDENGVQLSSKTLQGSFVFPHQTSGNNSMSWEIEIGDNSIRAFRPPASGSSTTYNRKDGNYNFVIKVIETPAVIPATEFKSPSFSLLEGAFPRIKIDNANATISNWGIDETRFSVLKGCVNNDPRLLLYPFQCGIDELKMTVHEKDPNTGNTIGAVVSNNLTATERANIITGSGIAINGFTDGVNTISLVTGKYYAVTLTYTGQGQQKATKGSMSYKDGNWDLMIADNSMDNGTEPTVGLDVFNSTYLWNKLSTTSFPNSSTHETPTFVSVQGNTNKMLATIKNIGCVSSPANIPLRFFWTRARTDELWKNHWTYDFSSWLLHPTLYMTFIPGGSEITITSPTKTNPYNTNSKPYLIPSIASKHSFTIPFNSTVGIDGGVDWFPPDESWYAASNGSMTGNSHPVICLLARINEHSSTSDPIIYEPTGLTDKILPYVKKNNNVATRNTYVVEHNGFFVFKNSTEWNYGFGTVLANNDDQTDETVDICIDAISDEQYTGTFDQYGVIEIGTTDGLYNAWLAGGSQGTNITVNATGLFTINNSTHACLENITLPPGFSEQIGLRFNYNSNTLPVTPQKFRYQLSQNSGTEENPVYGSNTIFIADVPIEMPTSPVAKPNKVGNIVDNRLELSPNPTGDYLNINFSNNQSIKSVSVVTLTGQLIFSNTYRDFKKKTTIDVSALSAGAYIVNIENSGGVVSTSKFIKK